MRKGMKIRTIDLLHMCIFPKPLSQRRLALRRAALASLPQVSGLLQQLRLFPPPLDLGIRMLGRRLWWLRGRAGGVEGGDVRWIGGGAVDRCTAEGICAVSLEGAGA